MKICFLTQTATDISDFYKEFFKGQDLFFLTFKSVNDKAVAYLPKSCWSGVIQNYALPFSSVIGTGLRA